MGSIKHLIATMTSDEDSISDLSKLSSFPFKCLTMHHCIPHSSLNVHGCTLENKLNLATVS